MTCKDCLHVAECESIAMADFDYAHKMWMCDFWENAEERCARFKEKQKGRAVGEVKDNAGCKVD